jgi:hypothetical protein
MKILSKVEPMTIKSFSLRVALVAIFGCLITAGLTSVVLAQGEPGQPNVSAEEQRLVNAIVSAPDAAAKLKAAAELIKKYPKTTLRPRVASGLANEIAKVTDAAQKISLSQAYQAIFPEPSEQDLILPVLIDGYADAGRGDEAFSTGATLFLHQPDSVRVRVRLTTLGVDQAKKGNSKFVSDSLKHGVKAIELIEADKKPAELDDAGWKQYKGSVLPGLYQTVGALQTVTGDHVGGKATLLKAIELAPTDAYNYLLLGSILNEDYQDQAKLYRGMPDSQAKSDTLSKVLAMLDSVIDTYAHMIALSEGNAVLQPARQQCLHDMESYYKFRHNNSTAGMQQLIDKYKVPAKP